MNKIEKQHRETIERYTQKPLEHIPESGYYVYLIYRNTTVCYVGKGTGNRVKSHFFESCTSCVSQAICLDRDSFSYDVIFSSYDESECYNIERMLIEAYSYFKYDLFNTTHNNVSKRYLSEALNCIRIFRWCSNRFFLTKYKKVCRIKELLDYTYEMYIGFVQVCDTPLPDFEFHVEYSEHDKLDWVVVIEKTDAFNVQ